MKPADRLLNILTVLLLGLTAVSCVCIGSVFVNPLGVFNFLGPATVPVPLSVPTLLASTATATDVVFPTFPPEWTATVTPTATEAAPTQTPTLSATEGQAIAPVAGTNTPFPTPVGPTATRTQPEPPTSTATLPRPTATRTSGPYPNQPPSPTSAPPTPYP